MFREQVATVTTWFDRWTPCEQTVAMVALVRRLQPTQAKFLTSVIQRQVSDCGELRRSEILANDASYVASLATSESKEALVRDLLAHLPLLNPKSTDVKSLYLALIPKVLKYTLDHCSMMEEARQLLSYSLIHPAFSVEDRGLFSPFLHQFEEKLSSTPTNIPSNDGLNHHYSSSISGSPPVGNEFSAWQSGTSPSNVNCSSLSNSPSQGGLIMGNMGGSNFQRIRRSNSLTPPVLHSDTWNSQEELYSSFKPRSLSLSSEVSPQSSLASSGSGSENHLDDSKPVFNNPGMRDVPAWLKSLRLHKYSALFAHLTFEEMMELTEEGLEAQGVTKGARHKIVLSIGKLKERSGHLRQIYEDMTGDKESIKNALSEVKWMLTTPIKPTGEMEEATTPTRFGASNSENVMSSHSGIGPIGSNRFQDEGRRSSEGQNNEWHTIAQPNAGEVSLTSWIVRVVGKACELNPDIECEGLLVSVLDKCLSHDAFTYKQKRLLSLWRQQQAPIRRNSFGHHGHFHPHSNRRGSGSPNCGTSCGSGKPNRHLGPRALNLNHSSSTQQPTAQSWSPSSSIHAMFMAKRPSLQDSILESVRSPHSVQRTKSAPLPNFLSSLSCSPPNGTFYEQMSSGGSTLHPPSMSGNGANMLGKLDFSPVGLLGPTVSSGVSTNGTNGTSVGTSIGTSSANSSFGQSNTTSAAMDITSRLESLCLSMTEAALGPAFNSY